MDLLAFLFFLLAKPSEPSEALKYQQCIEPKGWGDVVDRDPRFVIFGELHGTQQAPDFIGSLTCGLGSKGQRILVAVELSAADDQRLQEVWKLPTNRFEESLLEIGWQGRRDGVASTAMFNMLVRLHTLKEQGQPVSVVAFNGTKDRRKSKRFADLPGQGPHEAEQAENIAEASNASDYDWVLVLVGNFHARKKTVEWPSVQFDPMAKRLGQHGDTISLNMRYAEGTSWSCIMKPSRGQNDKQVADDAMDCGIHLTRGSTDLGPDPFIEVTPSSMADQNADYDGYFWLGPISASPPVAMK